ncbi:MAG: hypothetical protein WHS38_06670 [Thermodesulforhabdaceae bacterium]
MDKETSVKNLAKALDSFIREKDFIESLACGMLLFLESETVDLDRLIRAAGPDYLEVLLLAFEWKLILPLLPSKTCAWEDLAIVGISAKLYSMPKAVYYIIRQSAEKGFWDVEGGLKVMFKTLDVPASPDKMTTLVQELFNRERFMSVSARDIDLACRAVGLPGLADPVIAIFKGFGIISPKLSHVGKSVLGLGPLYDLNPSLGCKLIEVTNFKEKKIRSSPIFR